MLDKDGNVIELKEDEDAMDTFNLARMDADDDRHRAFSEEAEFQESGFESRTPRRTLAQTSTWLRRRMIQNRHRSSTHNSESCKEEIAR